MSSLEFIASTDTTGSLPDGEGHHDARQQAIEHKRNTALLIKQALNLFALHNADSAKLQNILEAARDENERLADRLNNFINPIQFNQRIPSHAAVPALKLFNIAELLELILINLTFTDLY
ncbi:hypothetical protein LTR36_002731 [Oleoguttula mirabilis]|uniref:Uncharacterized protein n=1 Tax=Oleoguttula mirabilis TaxID=1507867 RepID=A0AAV9JKN9_9PEZI|nr:hypothetical protein LTR36_002731 [Oleoguttula mirabilis]